MLNQQTITDIENEFLQLLINNLQEKVITVDEAKLMTQNFINLYPFSDADGMIAKIKTFTENHSQFQDLYISVFKKKEQTNISSVLEKMRVHLQNDEADEVLKLAK